MSNEVMSYPQHSVALPYYSIRSNNSPEDLKEGRRIYCGQTTVDAIVNLPTDENVRDYILDAEGKERRRPSQVHRAIEETLKNNPEDFSVLNSGIVLVARNCVVNEKDKVLTLSGPSIINGAQTQGIIKDYLKSLRENQLPLPHIKFELIVTDDEDLIAEISIARNFQNNVMSVSIAGRRGQLDELELSLQKAKPGSKLQKSETKLSEDYVKTERLLQVITALIPEEVWLGKEFNKVYSYSMKAKCLKDFQLVYTKAHDSKDPDHAKYKELYQFYLDIAPHALDLYEKWKIHQGFQGCALRSIEREGRNILEVPDGIVFPILAAHSVFAQKTKKGWVIKLPSSEYERELIRTATSVYKDIASHNPNTMGKSKPCYSALYQITSIYSRLSGLI